MKNTYKYPTLMTLQGSHYKNADVLGSLLPKLPKLKDIGKFTGSLAALATMAIPFTGGITAPVALVAAGLATASAGATIAAEANKTLKIGADGSKTYVETTPMGEKITSKPNYVIPVAIGAAGLLAFFAIS